MAEIYLSDVKRTQAASNQKPAGLLYTRECKTDNLTQARFESRCRPPVSISRMSLLSLPAAETAATDDSICPFPASKSSRAGLRKRQDSKKTRGRHLWCTSTPDSEMNRFSLTALKVTKLDAYILLTTIVR